MHVCVCEGSEAAEPEPGVWATAGWESLCHAGAAERKYSTEEAVKGKVRTAVSLLVNLLIFFLIHCPK